MAIWISHTRSSSEISWPKLEVYEVGVLGMMPRRVVEGPGQQNLNHRTVHMQDPCWLKPERLVQRGPLRAVSLNGERNDAVQGLKEGIRSEKYLLKYSFQYKSCAMHKLSLSGYHHENGSDKNIGLSLTSVNFPYLANKSSISASLALYGRFRMKSRPFASDSSRSCSTAEDDAWI